MVRRDAFLAASAVACALTVSACAEEAAAPVGPRFVRVDAHGVAAELPPGWVRASGALMPHLLDPREVLSVATFRLQYRPTRCAHVAGSALEDLGARGAFVTLEERGVDPRSDWPDFPPRPARFGPELGGPSEAAACVPNAPFTDHWFRFTDGDRHFHVEVAFGPDAPAAVQRQAWQILDSLQIDPRVRPDWPSSE